MFDNVAVFAYVVKASQRPGENTQIAATGKRVPRRV
jgi:hypothetical protein